jgi:hypothetical protein
MKSARILAIAALAFLGLTAIAGSVPMLMHPEGSANFLPPALLDHSPFHSFLIPGILLLIANGLLSLLILVLVIRRRWHFGWFTAGQGVVLAIWLAVQMVMLRVFSWLHLLYCAVALLMIVTGALMSRDERINRFLH